MAAAGQRQNLSANAAEYIREKIVSGEFPPGHHITENSIAKALNISRGPIREALKILEQEGMVNYEPNCGYTAVFLSAKDTWEVFFLRGHLEKLSLEAAGGKISTPHFLIMEHSLEIMENAQKTHDVNDLVSADERFHLAVVENGGITRLTHLWKILSPMNKAMFYAGNRAAVFDFYVNQWEAHVNLFEILRRGNVEDSCAAILTHYLLPGEKIYKSSL